MSATEYRLTWRREGLPRRSALYQTRRGAERRALLVSGQVAEYTGLDPDAFVCCDGSWCGCGGLTRREDWAEKSERVPPLVEGPTIEERTVGAWAPVSGGGSTR